MSTDKIIVALDLETPEEAISMAKSIAPIFPFFKIGMKLFTRAGPVLVQEVLRYGKVFLDLKFYDIPSVVADASYQAARLGVSLLTLHASGGFEMMNRAAQKVHSSGSSCRLLGVTVLTSFESLSEFGIARTTAEQVDLLAELSHKSGMDGIVCSAAELNQLRGKFSAPFLLVTPGIRGASDEKGDQKRTASAPEAVRAGADYLVIGRPIISDPDPVGAAKRIAGQLVSSP